MIPLTTPSLRSSVNWIVEDASRSGKTKPITKRGNVHCDWFILSPLFSTPAIWFSLDHKRNVSGGVGRKWKRSYSSDSDSVALFIFFDIHKVISALMSLLTMSDSDSVASENQPSS